MKQRLLGAIVLTALAVIFVPMLFEEDSDSAYDPRDFEIPRVPARIAQKPLEPPESLAPADIDAIDAGAPSYDAGAGEELTAQTLPGDEVLAPIDEAEESKQPLKAWVIQLGSFSKTENADQLQNRLREAKFPAYVESVEKDGTTLFRVRVGPELDAKRAKEQRDRIEEKFGIKGIVLSEP